MRFHRFNKDTRAHEGSRSAQTYFGDLYLGSAYILVKFIIRFVELEIRYYH